MPQRLRWLSMKRAGRILLVRHGESTGNVERQFSRDSSIDLTERGVAQARATGEAIAKAYAPTRIIASSYYRAQRTAGLIAECLEGAFRIEVEEDLRERSIGDLAGEPYGAMAAHPDYDPERYWAWRPPQGAALEDVQERAGAVLQRVAAAYPDQDVVLVSHGGTMLALCAHVEGSFERPRVAGNCEVVVVEHDAGRNLSVVASATPSTAGAEETGG